ncbi:MAG: hypothetical protein HY392_01685 [Candidatus Diapherotrites archaeon]|nr:hypothetical protein [Candidatus Diapherotrites archaeon]
MSETPRRLRYKKKPEDTHADKTTGQNSQEREDEKSLPQNYEKFMEEHATRQGMKELHRFREEHDRFPERQELEQMAQSIYSQWKAREEKNERYHHHGKAGEKKQGEKSGETSLAEKRKSRREALAEKRKQLTGQRKEHGHGKQKKGKEEEFKEPQDTGESKEDFEEPGETEGEVEKQEDLSGLLGEEGKDTASFEENEGLSGDEDGKDMDLSFFEEEKNPGKKKKPVLGKK